MKNTCFIISFLLLSLHILFISYFFSITYYTNSHSHRITNLPGQPVVEFDQYSGYLSVDEKQTRFLFYYFVEAEEQPTSKPIVMWLHGGPGFSSVGFGAFKEHGPFKPTNEGLVKNDYSWNKEANILYLDSPAGVGFSYSSNKSFYYHVTDEMTARDNLVFLQHWFTKFTQYKNNEFFITGESYAGHFAPQLAELIVKTKTNINLKGIAIGNPLLEFNTDYNSRGLFLWSHGLISHSTYELLTKVCNFSRIKRGYESGIINSTCLKINHQLDMEVGSFTDPFDVSQHPCLPTGDHTGTPLREEKKRADCFLDAKILKYFNKKGVQKAFHAKISPWRIFSGVVLYDPKNHDISTISLLGTLVKSGVRVMVFSGDQDAFIPFLGTQSLLDGLAKDIGLNISESFRPWYNGIKVAGSTVVYGDILTFATIKGAGHSSASSQPEATLVLLKAFLKEKSLPKF